MTSSPPAPVPGFDLRTDPLTGNLVVITASRQARPNLPATGCPFCVGGLEAPEDYDVRWFPNRWPAIPDGRAEVVLYTPDHDATFWSLGVEGATRVVELWAERTSSLGGRADVAYVLPFENRGKEVGATISHPHGQIYAFPDVPPAPAGELSRPHCGLCRAGSDEHLVTSHGSWRAEVPAAAAAPFELLLWPAAHLADLPAAASVHREMATVLVDALARLDQLFDAPMPYMLWIHQRPTDGRAWPAAHLHVHISPFLRAPGIPRFVAAGELGSGVFFNPVAPESAAARLRELRGHR